MNYLVLPACEDANFLSALKLVKDIFDIIETRKDKHIKIFMYMFHPPKEP